ncbi:hypothetical protein ACS8Y6_08655 [Salinisphaera sp. RV14]|uniref:hypothetical protein n=1 Tax=Salinisphaera sp. RV14 TaxID=3454140 RepID=UPI003F83EC79
MRISYHFHQGVIAAVILAAGTAAAQAGATHGAPSANLDVYRLGYTATHFYRQEHSFDSQKGWINGIDLQKLYIGNHFYYDSDLGYSAGSAHYDGGVQYVNPNTGQVGSQPYSTSIDEKLLTSHVDMGPVFRLAGGRDAIVPFIGIGVRYHYDHTSTGRVTAPGFGSAPVAASRDDRLQAQARFGAMDRFAITRRLGLELKGLATYNFYGRLSNTQYSGNYKGHDWGYVGSATADYQLTRVLGIYARASYTRVHTSRIQLSQTFYEPSASSGVTRLTVGAQAHF